ncbi:MAG: purine-binding chemotaxis protein CheW [Ferruginibacter sp.]|nr:purine-binding chemotaxis protein CheW [Cytophagales bacterium]
MAIHEETLAPVSVAEAGSKYHRRQLIVFKQGQEEYGLTIDQIKEVVITPPITRMPQTPSFVKGVANIRGNIIAIIDLEEKFGLRSPSDEAPSVGHYTLVVESEEFKIGILVKEVPNTLTVSEADIEESTNLVLEGAAEGNYLKGIVKVKDRLIILMDIFQVMRQPDIRLALKK